MFNRVMITVLVFALIALSVTARDDKKDDEQDHKDKLQGEWTAVSVEGGPVKWTDEAVKNTKLVFKGDEYLLTLAGRDQKFTFKFDPTKNPKEIDLFRAGKDEVASKGIYKLEGDKLTICRVVSGKADRPKEFKSSDSVGLSVFKRAEKK